jgi:hypothetical protein
MLLGGAILAQLAGYYLLALSFHYIGIEINKPPDPIPTSQQIFASSMVYFFSLCSFGISGTFAVVLKRLEKRLSPYVVSAFLAPSILLVVSYALWIIVTKL